MISPAQAARIVGESIDAICETPIWHDLASALYEAADRMDAIERAAVAQAAAGHACSLDHRTIKGPLCPVCKAPKGSA